MDASRWKRVRELFEHALTLAPAERDAWLMTAAEGDAELLVEVSSLLAADEDAGDTAAIARTPRLAEDYAERAVDADGKALTGRRFGPYSVTGELGRGGMGAVYLAERVDGQYRSEVAIKLIRASWGADELVARFAAERRILASLDHPNIARLLDAGIGDGQQPYLVLEYVRGRHIGVHCDHERLGIVARLELFLSVCAAVSHAHDRLVVHRDLKPSNILVGTDGQVKLLDFGVAKLIGGDVEAAQTAADERIFTPEYAAPEQILGESITTAVDVYALGLLLYELLTGARAHRVTDHSRAAVERAVLGDEPLRPSAAITRLEPGRAQEVAGARGIGLPRLGGALRGDLDAIVMKALRKKPADRYASVRELADDLRRHLERRPVAARQGDRRYRMLRFAERHRLALGFGGAALLSLVAGLGMALWQAHEARLQRDLARAETEKSRQALAFVSGVFAIADPGAARGAQVTARELLERGAERIRSELTGQPEVRAELLGVLGRSYLGLGLYPKAVELGTEAVALRRQLGDPSALGEALKDQGLAALRNGHADDAIPMLAEAESLLAAGAGVGDLRAGSAAVLLGAAYQAQGKLSEADAALERAQSRLAAAGGERSVTAIEALAQRTNVKILRGDLVAADRFSSEALALATATLAEDDPKRSQALKARATALQNLGRDTEAEPIRRRILAYCERVYGREHTETVSATNDLATALYTQKRYAEVAPLFERVVELRRRLQGAEHPNLATALNNLASLKVTLQQPAEAEPLFREALAIRRRNYGDEHYNVATTLLGLGMAENALGRPAEAAADLTEALRVTRVAAPDNLEYAVGPLSELAQAALDVPGRDPDCALAREAVDLRAKLDPKNLDHGGRLAMARAVLGVCLLEHGDAGQGRALIDASIDKARAGLGAESIRIRLLERHLARR